jgi:oxygen-independent coproporphyrinogen-3 oxidase
MAQIGQEPQAVVECENIDVTKAAGEFMFLGLRLTEGVSIETFRSRFGKAPEEFYPCIRSWVEGDFLDNDHGRLRLTRKGLLLANSILVEFM